MASFPSTKQTMEKMHFISVVLLIISCSILSSIAVPLSTKSEWIINEATGERVKLKCVNWEGHLKPMLPEGLHKQRINDIGRRFVLMGFNCVRLTYATHMFTRHSTLTVAQNFRGLNLSTALEGILRYNHEIVDSTLPDAQRFVIEALGSLGIMVLLDCQVSKPMWCCKDDDGNGFFGDEYFDPHDWLQALSIVAKRYRDTPNVVAMSLRNELRGPGQNVTVWHHYIPKGAETIHRENPNVLVLISGMWYDTKFDFLKKEPLKLDMIMNKLVYEVHRYAWTGGGEWTKGHMSSVCEKTTQAIEDNVGFLRKGKDAAPLFVSEFGGDEMGGNEADNNFLTCFMVWLAQNDLDWSLWAGQGSYYLKFGKQDDEETYGILDSTWEKLRSQAFYRKMGLILQTLQDPFSSRQGDGYLVLYHPTTGNCGVARGARIYAGSCYSASKWMYHGEGGGHIRLEGSNWCLTATRDGLPVVLTDDCTSDGNRWNTAKDSPYQLASNGGDLCLGWNPNYFGAIFNYNCSVADKEAKTGGNDPSQWFVLVQSNAQK